MRFKLAGFSGGRSRTRGNEGERAEELPRDRIISGRSLVSLLCGVLTYWQACHTAIPVLWLCIIARSALSAYCGSPQYAEFEREILRERTRAGLANARQNGKRLGRPMTAGLQAAEIRKLHRAGVAKAEIARRLQIGRTSVRRILA
jgi:hypothetical protein